MTKDQALQLVSEMYCLQQYVSPYSQVTSTCVEHRGHEFEHTDGTVKWFTDGARADLSRL